MVEMPAVRFTETALGCIGALDKLGGKLKTLPASGTGGTEPHGFCCTNSLPNWALARKAQSFRFGSMSNEQK